nr:hypothetical protein [Tanacetum cinerariifolium]
MASSSGSGTLPGNTVTNPNEDLKGITTRSGVAYKGPTIPTMSKVVKQDMDLFSLISAPNPAKVKIKTHLRAAHEVPLLTATANRVIDMKYMTEGAAPVGNPPYTGVAPEPDLQKETIDMGALVSKRRHKRGPNAPPKVLRKYHVVSHPPQSTLGGKSLAPIGIGTGTTISAPATQEIPVHTEGVSDPDPLSYAKPRPAPEQDVAQSSRKAIVTEDPDSEKSTSFTSMVGSLITPYSHHQPLYQQSQFQPQATSYQSSPYRPTYHNSQFVSSGPSSLTHSISYPGTDTSSLVNHNAFMASSSAHQIAYAQMDQKYQNIHHPKLDSLYRFFRRGVIQLMPLIT